MVQGESLYEYRCPVQDVREGWKIRRQTGAIYCVRNRSKDRSLNFMGSVRLQLTIPVNHIRRTVRFHIEGSHPVIANI
jgi:hypothetical protein